MKYTALIFGLVAGGILPAAAQTFGVSYTSEVQYAPTNCRTNWCNLLRTDFRQPIYSGGEFRVVTIHIYKASPKRVIADRMIFSNIEEKNNPFAIAVLGYTQQIGSSSLFLGVRNMNEDYFTSPETSLFTNSSCGIYPTISTNYPIANYPLSSLCLDYKGQFGQWNVKGSLYNGVGYSGWSKGDNPFIFDFKQDGIFGITEINYQTNYGSYFCGASLHNRLFLCDANAGQRDETISAQTQKKRGLTWWGYAEQRLWAGTGHEINLLVQYSQDSSASISCKQYAGLGVTWLHKDSQQRQYNIGVVFSAAQFCETNEFTVEVTYRYLFRPNSYLQPAVHLIWNNGGFHPVFMFRFSYAIDWSFKRSV